MGAAGGGELGEEVAAAVGAVAVGEFVEVVVGAVGGAEEFGVVLLGGVGLEDAGEGVDGGDEGAFEGVFFFGDGFESAAALAAASGIDAGLGGDEGIERADEGGRCGGDGGVLGAGADGAVHHGVKGFVGGGHCGLVVSVWV